MARILVLYGTTEGHTARIAQSIAAMLRTAGTEADVVPADRSFGPSPRDYDGVLVAASVHRGRFQRHIRRWLLENVNLLRDKPTAFVAVCLGVLQRDPVVQAEVTTIVTRLLLESGWRPAMTKVVAGALLYSRYGWIKRWLMKRIAAQAGGDTDTSRDYEYTNWNDVRTFAEQYGRLVRSAECTPGAPQMQDTRIVA
jgi:menaquinone-dependent protoporphyrinogen oxidase